MILLAILLLNGQVVSPPALWQLTVAIDDGPQRTWLSHRYGSLEECQEDLLRAITGVPIRGRVSLAYCEPGPRYA